MQMDMSTLRGKLGGQHKLTTQRKSIFQVLTQSMQGHLSPEEVYNITREKHPEIGLATVYRTLHLFEQAGLVERLAVDNGRILYELCKDGIQHSHMVCLVCGRVFDMYLPESAGQQVDNARWQLGDFHPIERKVFIYGYCNACLMQKERLEAKAILAERCM